MKSGENKAKRSGSVSKLRQPTEIVKTDHKRNSVVIKDNNVSNFMLEENKENWNDQNNAYYNLNYKVNKRKQSDKSDTDIIASRNKQEEMDYNPYSIWDTQNKHERNSSRDSSMTKSSMSMKKPPTVPKPFRLSSTNLNKKDRDKTPEISQERASKSYKFKAKKVPNSHRVPFMVLHSTKNLTNPEIFSLKTDERSQSRHRSNSGKQENSTEAHKYSNNIGSINNYKAIPSSVKNQESKENNMFDVDIDFLIKAQEIIDL